MMELMAWLTSEASLVNHSYLWGEQNSARFWIYLGSSGASREEGIRYCVRDKPGVDINRMRQA